MNRRLLVIMGLAALLAALLLAGCRPVTTPLVAPLQDAGALTVDALQNATYSGIYDDPVTLTDGRYEGEPFVAGGAERPTVTYEDGAERYGDLDGDGVEDAVVFLVENSGGTGNFVYVAAQLNRDGQPLDAGAVWIEDRIQVKSAAINGGQIVLEIITEGPGDAACCKSHQASKRYALQDGQLVEIPGEAGELPRVSAADLEGTSWTLIELGAGQPALAEPAVTVSFQDGQISGSGGCNSYTGSFTLGEENPFAMTVGPLAATAMACPEPVQNQEDAYFAALGTVSQWGYWYGNLAMYYLRDDGSLARLLFAPTTAQAGATDLDALTAHPWQWVSFTNPLEQFEVEAPERYLLTFGEDGIVEIVADCNTAIASYGVDGTDAGSLSMSVAPRTTDTCPPASRGDQFLKLLGGAARYFYRDGQLYIDLFADGGTMVFAPAAAETPAGADGGAAGNAQAMLVETLGNLTYSGLFPDRTITLVDGRADYEEEGPGTPFVSLVDQLTAVGDLDGDGAADAVALLEDHSSGSGNFLFLAAVLNAATTPTPTTALMLGDRIQVKSLAIEGDQVVVELVAQGGSDPACCPTWNVRKRFALQDGALAETGSEELSQVTLADLNGTRWQLVDLGEGQAPLLPDAEITLAIDDGQTSGFAGCNDYTGSVAGDAEVLQSFTVGPIAATQKLCPDPVSSQEATYLSLLSSVLGWRYDGGFLALAYPAEESVYAYLRFAPL